jgi:glycolate oxidase subunit GlcD
VNALIKNLSAVVGPENVLSKPDELLVYECDGLPQHKHRPHAVVFPSSTEQTAAVMRELAKANVPFTPRGAGTGLSGGALALNEGVVIELARMRQILKIDTANRLAVVQPGVVNLQVSRAVAPFGLYYVPDPSSQPTCTIGGNIAEGAGGIHCLKYGTTTDHVLGCRVVLAGGEVVDLGDAGLEVAGYDLLGTFIGSEGTFGIATEATLKLVQNPPAVRTLLAEFAEVNDASHAVSAIIAAGVMPAALEMMDHEIIRAVEASVFAAGLPPDAAAALLIELDGIEAGLDDEAARVIDICMEYGARSCRAARDESERKKLWAARKGAFGAIGRISPDSMIQDAVVPRSRLPEVLSSAYEIAYKYQLRVANVFHAGDGNLHPLICFDSRFPDQVKRVKEAGRELMEVCVAAGGTITGEHGVGLDKRELLPLVFSETDINAMLRVRAAFDPYGLCNPGKIIPMLRGCGEGRAVSLELRSTRSEQNVLATTQPHVVNPKVVRAPFKTEIAAVRLAEIVGDANVVIEGSYVVVYPSSVDETVELVRCSSNEAWTVTPAGSMTWLQHGRTSNLVISTARLNRIIEHEPADLIAVAEAGVGLTDFNKELAKNGQWLPLDPPDDGRATLGGVVSTGLGGAQQFAYGKPRGSVIGMKVVLADGSLIKAGGRVVKNVAGYDLCKLFTGSYGTLGIIVELNFKLRPRPAREQTVVAIGSPSDLVSAGRAILQSRLFPVGIELISSALAKELGITITKDNCALLVRFGGNEKGVAYQMQQALLELSAANQIELIEQDGRLWESLAAIPLKEAAQFSCLVSMLPDKVGKFIESLAGVYGEAFHASLWQVGLADGRMRMIENAEHHASRVREIVSSVGGNFTFEGLNIPNSQTTSGLMNRIKQQLDPAGLFSMATVE